MLLASRTEEPVLLKGLGSDLVVAGYASVEMVDKQGDLITRSALGDAFKKYMKNPEFRNVQLAHSNIQVGSVVPTYTDSGGRVWKSEVDDTGLFVVISLRNDIEKAREVAAEVRKGNLKSFSIGGQAFERVNKHDQTRGDYREISRMELHEVTICEKGINPEAQFRILKEDTSMSESDTMNELHSVLERLSKRLDDVEKADEEIENSDEDVERGLPFLDGGDDEKPPAKKKSKKDDDSDDDDDDDDGDDDMTMAYSDGLADTITTDYLTWLEQTAKASGHDPSVARAHFDGVSKGYGPGQSGYDHRGQGSLEGAGEDDSSKRPKMDMGSAPSGNKTVIKGQNFIAPNSVSSAQIEEAYEVYKAASVEKQFKNSLGNYFEDRLTKEQANARNNAAKSAYDSRSPIQDLQKAVLALNDRIDTVSNGGGEMLTKSVDTTSIGIPETVELASMSWDDVHRLAGKALKGE